MHACRSTLEDPTELALVDRSIAGIAITIGRFRVPGGFWLMADGAQVARRWRDFQLGVFAGSRSFTNARVDTLLTGTPMYLPLLGTAIETRGAATQARLAYTRTFDRIELPRGDGVIATSVQPEQFVDGEWIAKLGKRLVVTGGANLGSRYLVAYPTRVLAVMEDPRVANVWFGSQAAYALVDWRTGAWRLSASAAALRTKLGEGSDTSMRSSSATVALAAITGSFVEGTLRATWRQRSRDDDRRVDGRWRTRVFADGRQAFRAQLLAEWRAGTLDVQASAGADVHRGATAGYTNSRTLLYKASLGRKTADSELAWGAAAVSAIGDELSLSEHDQRAPFTLEARSYAFVRMFATHDGWFAGADGEVELGGQGTRVLAQVGYAR